MYGPGRFGYSLNSHSEALTIAVTSGSWKDVGFDSNLSASAAASEVKKVTVSQAAVALAGNGDADVDAVILRSLHY